MRSRRSGFTLIELMIVIVIIILLIALLLPAINYAVRKARIGKVQTEISSFDYAIADFKAALGTEPPGYIDFRLYPTAACTAGTEDPAGDFLPQSTQAKLRRLWPNIDMASLIADLQASPKNQKELDGEECLVFWLGGVVVDVNGIPMGFSSNPRTPLRVTATGKRIGPFYEFDQTRLYDENPSTDPAVFDGYEGYNDPLPNGKPYQFVTRDRYAAAVTAGKPVYKVTASTFFKADGYQIVSAGYDSEFGVGGLFDSKKETITNGTLDTSKDADNITNFTSGPLIP